MNQRATDQKDMESLQRFESATLAALVLAGGFVLVAVVMGGFGLWKLCELLAA